METPAMVKARQESDASNRSIKRSLKAAAFENSCTPNEDWNNRLDTDMLRNQKSRALESNQKKQLRKEKDASYQKKKRSEFSDQQRKEIRKQ